MKLKLLTMGLQELAINTLVKLKQKFGHEALIMDSGEVIPLEWINRGGHLVAFFPSERTDFTQRIEGVNARSLANAYILGAIKIGDRLQVRYLNQPDTLEMTYTGFAGYRARVLKLGGGALHHLQPDEFKPGVMYGGEITYWKKIEV